MSCFAYLAGYLSAKYPWVALACAFFALVFWSAVGVSAWLIGRRG